MRKRLFIVVLALCIAAGWGVYVFGQGGSANQNNYPQNPTFGIAQVATWNGDTGISRSAAGTIAIGTGAQGASNGSLIVAQLVSGAGAPTLSGTGTCATTSTQVGGQWAGSFVCTGTSGAATITITFSISAHAWACNLQDQTTSADKWAQTGNAANSCTLSAAALVANDVTVFNAFAY